MDRDRVKFLIQSIEVLLEDLKSTVYTDDETFKISDTSYSDVPENSVSTDDIIQNMFPQITDDL
jgi:hypothetical protein